MPTLGFEVTQPPNSGGVKEIAIKALGESAMLPLTVLTSGHPADGVGVQNLSFHIRHTGHPRGGGIVVDGYTPDGEFVSVMASSDPTQPAIGHIISN